MRKLFISLLGFLLLLPACRTVPYAATEPQPVAASESAGVPGPSSAASSMMTVVPDINERLAQLPATKIDYDRTLLDANEQQVVAKLIQAARSIGHIFRLQVSERNPRWGAQLESLAATSPAHAAAYRYYNLMNGPWDRLKEDDPFIVEAGKKPDGAGFYPADITKAELEKWIADHPGDKEAFQGLFNVIRRENGRLVAIPYSKHYNDLLVTAAGYLREAAAMTKNASLRNFLNKRADAFLTDDYYESDIAWMDLDSDIEVVIGPYEVYEDEMFNYKAAFETFLTVVDRPESEKLALYARALPDMERSLPMPNVHKNPNRGTDSPIRVVQEIYTSGDARNGVQTAAFNLPNDERVREAKGSKKVLLKNVMEAKFRQSGNPIAKRVLDPQQVGLVSFTPYFNHTLFHELSHGLGPGIITGPDGKKIENRLLLKELYSAIEECKADVLGVWTVLYAIEHKLLTAFGEKEVFATDVGLMFRSMRFGIDEAHGRGNAVQWNWYREAGAIVPLRNGKFRVEFSKMRAAVKSLAEELLMIEATGDYARGKRLLDRYGKTTPEIDSIIAGLKDIPVDISPVFVAAGER